MRQFLKMPVKKFSANPHTNKDKVFSNRKKSIMKIYSIILISRNHCTLLIFHVVSLSLYNCFNEPAKRCIQIFHHLHRYEIPFSVSFLTQLYKITSILLKNSSVKFSPHLLNDIRSLIFQYGNTFTK